VNKSATEASNCSKRLCRKCDRRLSLEQFTKDKSRADGMEPYCRDCKRKKNNEYRSSNGDRIKAKQKSYSDLHRQERREKARVYNRNNRELIAEKMQAARAKDPEKYRAINRAWRSRNADKHRQISRDYRRKNKAKCRVKDKQYTQQPEVKQRRREQYASDADFREKIKARTKKHSARRRGAVSTETIYRRKVWERDEKRCYLCGLQVDLKAMHLEHKTPISRGGAHTYENVGCACARCNLSKQNKTEKEFRTWQLETSTWNG
jgi:5-methylcytosine-specific restriction endonuclease McrA